MTDAPKPTFHTDSLSQFTSGMASGYRDGPFVGEFQGTGYAKDFMAVYNASWIAKQAVERIPEDCFRKGYNWITEATDVGLLEAVEKRHKIRSKMKQAATLANRDGEAYLYVDVGDDPTKPINLERVKRGGLKFVNLFPQSKLSRGNLIQDPLSEFYGQPEYYSITGAAQEVRIHPSRICRFTANPDPETGIGRSVLMQVIEVIQAAETTRNNTVALTTQARLHIMKVCGLMDKVQDDPQQVVARYKLANDLMRTNGMLVIDKEGEDYDQKQPAYTTLPEVIETMRREVAAATGIPYALLFGRANGLGTNGEMELASYYDSIQSMQVTEIQPACEVLFECVIRSAIGSRPDDVYLEWQSLWQLSDKERAEIAERTANTVKTLVESNVVPADVLTVPTVTALSEQGALPGIEASYKEWQAGGGADDGDDGVDVIRPTAGDDA